MEAALSSKVRLKYDKKVLAKKDQITFLFGQTEDTQNEWFTRQNFRGRHPKGKVAVWSQPLSLRLSAGNEKSIELQGRRIRSA